MSGDIVQVGRKSVLPHHSPMSMRTVLRCEVCAGTGKVEHDAECGWGIGGFVETCDACEGLGVDL